jgi:hypothetical protein
MQTVAAFVHSNAAIKFDLPDLTEYKTESNDDEDDHEEDDEEIQYEEQSQEHDEL